MPMAKITPAGESGLYHVHFLDGRTDPGFGHPGGGGHPDQGLPGERPPHVGGGPIFHPGHPDHGLPSQPGHPGNRPPGSGVFPDNSLPSHPPPHVPPGTTLVLVRDPAGVWHYATLPPGAPPPTTLPEPTPPATPDQGLPPGPPVHPGGGPVQPAPTPTRR